MRRVVVTGLGVVAPNGIGKDAFWDATLSGRSGVRPIRRFDPSGLPVRSAGEVVDFDLAPLLPPSHRKSIKIMSRSMRFAVAAALMAVGDSGLNIDAENGDRLGVVMGAGVVPIDLAELAPLVGRSLAEDLSLRTDQFGHEAAQCMPPLWLLQYLPNMTAAHVSLVTNARGPNSTITTACTAGTQAVGEAFRLVARGDADIMLAGGADSRIDPLLMAAYGALGALTRADRPPEELSRPFDAERQGFVMGEGAGVLVLEEMDRARRRDARIYAEILGLGTSFDAYSVTKPDPTGRGAVRAIQEALREARVNPDEVDYINAHGTGTRLNDFTETCAVKQVFGAKARRLPLSSIKSMVGHLIGAAGAVEAVALALTLNDGAVPPTINLTRPDPQCDLDYVPREARRLPVRTALSTSFGFGGQNAALVMQRLSA